MAMEKIRKISNKRKGIPTINPKEKFLSDERNVAILKQWNTTASSLEEIAKPYDVSRERIRQILGKGKKLGIKVISSKEKFKKRGENKLKNLLEKHSKNFISLYCETTRTEITKSLGISSSDYDKIKKHLLNEQRISNPLYTRRKNASSRMSSSVKEERRKRIIQLKAQKKTINEKNV